VNTPADAPRKAVALRLDPGDAAPRVVAKGEGYLAQALLERAQAAGVPVDESPELATMLMQLDVDVVVPPALYAVVAEVLAWAYGVDSRAAERGRQRWADAGRPLPPGQAPAA
jgi:flagellar biosynthesis protein